jgi:excisionase family DNA binding protein
MNRSDTPRNGINAFEGAAGPRLEESTADAESMESLIRLLSAAIAMRFRANAALDSHPAPMLTVAQAADLLRVSRMTVIRKADAGELPCVVINSGKRKKLRRFPRQFIEDLALGVASELRQLDQAARQGGEH